MVALRVSLVLILATLVACSLALPRRDDGSPSVRDQAADKQVAAVLDPEVGDDDDEDDMPVLDLEELLSGGADEHALRWCRKGKCSKKCNKKGKNGYCLGPKCICFNKI